MHVSRQARDLVGAALEGTSLETVVTNWGPPLIDVDMPVGIVRTAVDTSTPFSKGTSSTGPQDLRTIGLTVELVLFGDPETIDDDVDELRAEVEPLVAPALTSIARTTRWAGGDMDIGTDEDGESWYAVVVLSWEVEIVTPKDDPETAIT